MTVSTPRSSTTARNARKVDANTDTDDKRVEYGLIGKLLGGFQMAPISAACILAVLSLVAAAIAAVSASPTANDNVQRFLAIVVACLSFLGGVYGGKGRS
ncbi:hypothetical protein [Bosea sp. FBZP-16]|uniref:hypothetical protein n=1 Tax=Bosea sp. FBZP-16 TaxID=2065382 RepID=UPI001319C0B9|nr:hypothetical protein [Bosea sp. FBZP-16]